MIIFCLVVQQEEVSEAGVRVSLVEKKLETASRDGDERVDIIQRQLDDALNNMRKKEKWVLVFMSNVGKHE